MLGERGAPGSENKGLFMGDLSIIMCDLTLVKPRHTKSKAYPLTNNHCTLPNIQSYLSATTHDLSHPQREVSNDPEVLVLVAIPGHSQLQTELYKC